MEGPRILFKNIVFQDKDNDGIGYRDAVQQNPTLLQWDK